MKSDINFDLRCLSSIIILRDQQGRVVKINKDVSNSFFEMHLLGNNIYLDNDNCYWQKNVNTVIYDDTEYYQEEYTNVTNIFNENKQLKNDLKKDPLTQIPNVNALQEKINEIKTKQENCIVVMCDVNNFKQINDTFGHNYGDKALVELSRLFTENIKNSDLVARIGGDEFIFLFVTTDKDKIIEKMEQIQQATIDLGKEIGLPLSISLGCSIFMPDIEWSNAYEKADTALYYVKNNTTDKMGIAYTNLDDEIELYKSNQSKLLKKASNNNNIKSIIK